MSKALDLSLVMLAAGESTRFKLPCKKQFLRLGGEPLWLYASKNISECYPFKKVIIASNEPSYMRKFAPHYEFVSGGASRTQSLKNALKKIESEFVLVSDVARVLISKELVFKLIENAKNAECISPALKVADTVLYNDEPIKREQIKLIQTPQLSRTALLKKALQSGAEFTDDSTAVASAGGKIWFVEGEEKAHKITFKEDLKRLKLPAPTSEIFCGNGFDVHAFGKDRPLILGGIEVHKSMGVKAHSDGDLIAHALIDALLGAASLGDIGTVFPDTDAKFKDANSMKLLQTVYKRVLELGYELVNADLTVIAEQPKLAKFKEEIAFNVSKCLGVAEFRINVKATTSEKMGFIGRGEGIGVLANVNLRYFNWVNYV
ncbi:bifunctional 2-C-methyl-D-erythritol 4-phosphate cytidylyltransferase/2-C-methyl-D-erythritol 2,4-cyclodiphosphate synthase [Campylobacter troglodytis]|uniref:bifunctional 2-C-methyl-D-erythritol 4-phosphate cytidylyltransferase/2-C-methyl-D-erythritol 2,4-cyclodiphosphate synthase n=1 Tax=Campylobacter troglodytis TaxID=654363 RepID=UPI00115A2922|nr:bifunctional 2-C-methyl-D-erythritol 4-phosphate cytidylyltransferase/2-C-methyl-D-erythritol 2,4-cyclodiphosphate synthase [Campylobacter troglodytis]TQR60698.1 bifunctional 2-C-methyl-D-erythritol 4-phosphate cytidylyltransferase/2-C-methyl-D-erythritol 2,4-cyclodiphosphate synthase [Campylobacter troglodytis]